MLGYLLTAYFSEPLVQGFFYRLLEAPVNAFLAYAKKDPVRVASLVLAVIICAASFLTGTPLAVILGEVAAAAFALEKVRAAVTPTLEVLLHRDDVPPNAVPLVWHPATEEANGTLTDLEGLPVDPETKGGH